MRFKLTGSGEVTVTEEVAGELVAAYRLAPRRGSLVVVGLTVIAEADASGVTARALRRLSPARAVREGLTALGPPRAAGWRSILEVLVPDVPWADSALWRRIATPDRVQRLTREERLALTARVYVDSLTDGERKVNLAIAAFFGIPVSQSRERVREARRAGFLTYSPKVEGKRRGRIEGEVTPEAEEILEAIARAWLASPRSSDGPG